MKMPPSIKNYRLISEKLIFSKSDKKIQMSVHLSSKILKIRPCISLMIQSK